MTPPVQFAAVILEMGARKLFTLGQSQIVVFQVLASK
jgi:hypothetical protein